MHIKVFPAFSDSGPGHPVCTTRIKPFLIRLVLTALLLSFLSSPSLGDPYSDSENPFAPMLEQLIDKAKSSSDPAIHVEMANILRDAAYYFLDNDIFEASFRAFDNALLENPDFQPAFLGKAVLLYESRRFPESLALLNKFDGSKNGIGLVYRNVVQWMMLEENDKDKDKSTFSYGLCDFCRQAHGESFWEFSDGRKLCGNCYDETLNSPDEVQALFTTISRFLEEKMDLRLARTPECNLVDSVQMKAVAGQNLRSFEGVTAADLAGLYAPGIESPTIYILQGLPKEEAAAVMAHEYAHAWARENCPNSGSLGASEGFSQWVSYQMAIEMGFKKKTITLFLDISEYGQNFKHFEVYGRVVGNKELIALMREGAL